MKRTLLTLISLVVLTLPLHASVAHVYISDSGNNANAGDSCVSGHPKATGFFNTAGNWGAQAAQIGPGSTVHLCGTISTASTNTNILAFNGSGTSGNVITLKWEPGAVVQSPACGKDNGSCILVNNTSWILFDGNGTSPSVQNTANGSAFANHLQSSYLINAQNCSNCEFKNLTLANGYAMSDPSDLNGDQQYCLSFQGTNVSIHDNVIHDCYAGMDDEYQGGDANIQIFNNTITRSNWGIHIGNNAPTALSNVFIHNNDISAFTNWDSTKAACPSNPCYHHDGIFVVQNNFSSSFTNIQIYNNYLHGPMSGCNGTGGLWDSTCMTAFIFENTGFKSLYVYNNLLVGDGSQTYLLEGGISGDVGYNFFNNTLDCAGQFCLNFSDTPMTWKNNIFLNPGSNPNNLPGNTITADFNAYTSRAGVTPFFGEAHVVNTTNGNLALNASYIPNAGSFVIGAGANLTSVGITPLDSDKAGTSRPGGATAWDIGAYQFASASPSVSPVTLGPWTNTQVISQTLTASSFSGTVTWSKLSGTQPTGLSGTCITGTTGATCTLTGTLSAVGSFAFTIRATNGTSTVDTAFTNVTVNAVPSVSSSGALPAGAVSQAYSQALTTSGGTGSLTCSVVTGSLPTGTSFSGCTVVGTPTIANTYTFTAKATDSNSIQSSTSASLSITIAPPDPTIPVLLHVTTCGSQTFPGSCTIPATTAGSLLAVGFASFVGYLPTSVAATVTGGTCQEAGAARSVDTNSTSMADILYCVHPTAGDTSITITPSSSGTAGAVIWEFSIANAFDQTAVLNSQPAAASPSGASLTTAKTAHEAIVTILNPSSAVTGLHAGNAFTLDSTFISVGWGHLVTTATGTYTPQFDCSGTCTFNSSTASFFGQSAQPTSVFPPTGLSTIPGAVFH